VFFYSNSKHGIIQQLTFFTKGFFGSMHLLNTYPSANLIEQYDILFANNLNFITLISVCFVALLFILFLLTQANLLNLSFYPNSTFDAEKYSPYECGFTPFRTERAQFDIKFYLVALLFLVFDVELMFLLPYCMSYYYLGLFAYLIFTIFFAILILGFLIEWSVGMLVWKGEEELVVNSQSSNLLDDKIRKQHSAYYSFVNDFLKLYDYKHMQKKYRQASSPNKGYYLKKACKQKPLQANFNSNFKSLPSTISESSSELHKDNSFFFYESSMPFVGATTASLLARFRYVERQQKQVRIEWFFTSVYGQRYVTWLESLTPSQWDSTLER
jgi:NADH-quinone oxidoreductase subunit A